MATRSIKLKLYLFFLLVLTVIFIKNIYVSGLFKNNQVGSSSYTSPLSNFVKNNVTVTTDSNMFGLYEQQDIVEEAPPALEDIFTEQNKDYIGRLENKEFVLYATANFANKITANLLVKNIESGDVELMTVNQATRLGDITVEDLELSSITLTSNKKTIELKLFSYGS